MRIRGGTGQAVDGSVAAASAARWVVYWARTPSGQYYIGVTSNFIARQSQHGERFVVMQMLELKAMNDATAEGVEQLLIEAGRRQGGLANAINSISPKNPYYQEFTRMGATALGCMKEAWPSWLTP